MIYWMRLQTGFCRQRGSKKPRRILCAASPQEQKEETAGLDILPALKDGASRGFW